LRCPKSEYATGGTIAGAQSRDGSAGYKSGAVSVEDLIKAVHGVNAIADISSEQVSNIGSQNMNNAVWLKLAKRLNEFLSNPEVDGVVITHGTEICAYIAYIKEGAEEASKASKRLMANGRRNMLIFRPQHRVRC
jgi:L-asparaginase